MVKTAVLAWALTFGAQGTVDWGFLPPPLIPADNPITLAKIELGEQLFSDTRLSADGEYSCASCHQPELHFTDGRKQAVGAYGDEHARNTPTLYYTAYNVSYGWDDQGLKTLEQQHRVPLYNDTPVELGFNETLLASITDDPKYANAFAHAFNEPPSETNMIRAIASYVRSLQPPTRPFDQYLFYDQRDALTKPAQQGMSLFFSPRLGCSSCHTSLTFSGPIAHALAQSEPAFYVTGVGGGADAFRPPTLRMIRYTAPYMHNGSLATLEEVVAHYESNSSEHVPDFQLDDSEREQLIEFLEAL